MEKINPSNNGNPMDLRLRPEIANIVDLVVEAARAPDFRAANARLLAYGFDLVSV